MAQTINPPTVVRIRDRQQDRRRRTVLQLSRRVCGVTRSPGRGDMGHNSTEDHIGPHDKRPGKEGFSWDKHQVM